MKKPLEPKDSNGFERAKKVLICHSEEPITATKNLSKALEIQHFYALAKILR